MNWKDKFVVGFNKIANDLPSIETIYALRPDMVQVAQAVYDAWEQDDKGMDVELGSGGICQDIADGISEILNSNRIDAASVDQLIGETHVYVVAKCKEGVFRVDIDPNFYESGNVNKWTKTLNVTFVPNMVYIGKIDNDPNKFEEYIED